MEPDNFLTPAQRKSLASLQFLDDLNAEVLLPATQKIVHEVQRENNKKYNKKQQQNHPNLNSIYADLNKTKQNSLGGENKQAEKNFKAFAVSKRLRDIKEQLAQNKKSSIRQTILNNSAKNATMTGKVARWVTIPILSSLLFT